jgi:type IV pilus assembly protein PilV
MYLRFGHKLKDGVWLDRHQQRGVSLIEVLVAIVIASIGLLALAGVNATSIRYTKMSQYRGTATQLANDLGERMRANKAGIGGYALQASFSSQATLPSAASPLCDTIGSACTAVQIANVDLQSWRVLVRDQLPDGSAYIVNQSVAPIPNVAELTAADVWVVWRDPAVAADDAPTAANECPPALSVTSDPSVRCSYFRINL